MENQQKSEPGRLGGHAEKLAFIEGEEEPLTDFLILFRRPFGTNHRVINLNLQAIFSGETKIRQVSLMLPENAPNACLKGIMEFSQ